jgi:CubicO group peptidase (beta-lactamase class C family)
MRGVRPSPASVVRVERLRGDRNISRLSATFPRFSVRIRSFVWIFLFVVAACGGFSRDCVAQEPAADAVDALFADFVKPGAPGCSLAVARDGKLVYAKGYGLANVEENVPLTPDSVFDIGSTSKQFTAASIVLLEKQGKLSLNDDIRKYLPEIPDYGKKITILNLLNHTSGMRDYLALFDLAGINTDSVTTDEEAYALVTHQKALNFDPGSDWLYSNTGFFLLSLIVKRASGESLRDFAAHNIFQPLGMTQTQYRDSHTLLIANRALAYDPVKDSDKFTLNVSYFEQTGDGAVHTTTGDLLKWDENFYSGKIGGKEFVAELQEHAKLNSGKTKEYAKGLMVTTYRGLPVVRHGGAWGGYRAELLRFPEQHFSVVCLCNRSEGRPSTHANAVADLYLGSLMKPKEPSAKTDDDEDEEKKKKEVAISADEARAFAGDYDSEELGVTYRFREAGGKLQMIGIFSAGFARSSEFDGKILKAVGKDTFEVPDEGVTLRFERNAAGKPAKMIVDAGRTQRILFLKH